MKSLFVLGDSISMHYGPFLAELLKDRYSYSRKEAELSGYELDDYTKANGGDSGMVLQYLRQRYRDESFKPDLLLLNCGLHDVKTNPADKQPQVPPDAYRANLGEIIGLLKEKSQRIIWVRTTPVVDEIHNSQSTEFYRYNRDVLVRNEIADELMKQAGVQLIDLYDFTEKLGPKVYRDHVHFIDEVQKKQAEFIAENILEQDLGRYP